MFPCMHETGVVGTGQYELFSDTIHRWLSSASIVTVPAFFDDVVVLLPLCEVSIPCKC